MCSVNFIFVNVIEVLPSKIFGCFGPQGPLEIGKVGFLGYFWFFLLQSWVFLLFTVNFNVVNVKEVLASKILKYHGPQGPLGTLKDVFF